VITETVLRADTITAWMAGAEDEIKAQSDYLTQLDAAIGDGDHGTNMRRGFTAVGKALAGMGAAGSASGLAGSAAPTSSGSSAASPGQLLIVAGKTLVSTVGGASGPLWGSALRRAGRTLGDTEAFDGQQLALALDAAIEGVVDLGAASLGDKTMIDALVPAARALHEALDSDLPLDDALAAAAVAAQAGAEATTPMRARKGRASYLGERSIGHQDPGATSAVIIVTALSRAVPSAQA
jgi:phosphoenolpyruvate---glycerone phosphotransferase subunit DhaL